MEESVASEQLENPSEPSRQSLGHIDVQRQFEFPTYVEIGKYKSLQMLETAGIMQ
jgi:hypothetical protein